MTTPAPDTAAADLERAVKEITCAAPAYQKAYRYWRGTQTEVFASPNMRAALAQAGGENYNVSVGKRVVAAVTDRLEVTSVDVDDSASEALKQVQDDNRMDIKLPALFQKTVMYGDMYVTVWPEPDSATSDGQPVSGDGVEIILRSPEQMRAFYDPENEDRLLYMGLTWLQVDKRRRVTLLYPDRIERYVSRKPESKGACSDEFKDYQRWTPDAADPDGWQEDHDYGRVPAFHFRTHEPYGISELEDVYGAQNLLTKQVVTLASATEGYGWPLRAALSKAGTLGDRSAAMGWDDQQNIPAGSALNARQRGPSIKANPGDILKLHDTDALVSLPPADVASFTQPIELALTLINTVSGKNVYAHTTSSRSDSSGIAQQERDRPLVKIVEMYQRLFGAELKDLYEFSLALLGAGDVTVTIAWSEAQLTDDIASAQTAKAKQEAGVPQDETLVEMGYLPKKVEEWAKGTDLTNLETRVKLVAEIGTAFQQIGAAQQLGVIGADVVSAVFQYVIEGILPKGTKLTPPEPQPVAPAPAPEVDPAALPGVPNPRDGGGQ